MANLNTRQTFKVVEEILRQKSFTQYGLGKRLNVSFGWINSVCNWLLSKGFIERADKGYALKDVAGLLNAFSIYRDMENIKALGLRTSFSKRELLAMLPKDAILCLDTALEQYSSYFRSERVCAYVGKKALHHLKARLRFSKGNAATICLYEEKPEIAKTGKISGRNYTDEIRTVIDIACDNKFYVAEQLIKQLWGGKHESR